MTNKIKLSLVSKNQKYLYDLMGYLKNNEKYEIDGMFVSSFDSLNFKEKDNSEIILTDVYTNRFAPSIENESIKSVKYFSEQFVNLIRRDKDYAGYGLLARAVELSCKVNTYVMITKDIYPVIAKMMNINTDTISRNIRTIIECVLKSSDYIIPIELIPYITDITKMKCNNLINAGVRYVKDRMSD